VIAARQRRALPRQILLILSLVYAAALVVLLVVVAAARILDKPHSLFVVEAAEYYPNVVWYAAFLSTLGVLLWWTSVAACLLAGIVLRTSGEASARPFFAAALLSALLAVDDAFLVHDILFEQIFEIHGNFVFAAFALLFVLFVALFRDLVRASPWPLLALAVALFGASTVVDGLDPTSNDLDLLEEGLKFLGIVTWSTYFVWLAAAHLVAGRVRQPTPDLTR
jgi:hypothetical protein